MAQTTIVGGTLEITLRGLLREVGGLQTAQASLIASELPKFSLINV